MATNTAASFTNHTGNGSTANFSISFSYISSNEIDVFVGGVLKTIGTHYTVSGSTITFTSGNIPSNGTSIKFQRDTDISVKKVDFIDGSVLTEKDLDTNSDQILFGLQEFVDIVNNDLFKRDGTQTLTGSIVFEGSSDDVNETTLSVTNPTADRTITLPNASGNVVLDTATQTLTNKTITAEAFTSDSVDINGGAIDGTTIGANSAAAGTFTTGTISTANTTNLTNTQKLKVNSGSASDDGDGTYTLSGGYITLGTNDTNALQLFHDVNNNNSFISEVGTGDLIIATNGTNLFLQKDATSGHAEDFIQCIANGAVKIFHNSQPKLTTLTNGIEITGNVDLDGITGAGVVTSGTSSSDTQVYSAKRAEERFYGKDTLGEIQSGETWSSTDDKVATTAAIDARVIDLVDDVGGFVPIANELSFPNTNPDINNGAGTLVSIKALSTAYTSNSSGTFTISNGTVGNSTVTINGATASTTFAAGFGMILETTTTLNTYTFHRFVPQATEITTVAGSISNVNTVAGAISNVNAVGTNITNVNTVAGISANVTTVANDGTDIGTVAGISSNVTTVAGISGNVTTVAGISSNVTSVAGNSSNINTVAGNNANITTVAGISSNVTTVANANSNIGTVASSISNVNTTAGSIANVNTVAGSIANVNTVGTNITNVTNASNYLNNFLQLYLGEASSNPTADGLGNAITEGDLYFNTVDKRLRVFNGSIFQNLGEGLIEVAKFATAAFNTLYTASAGSNSIDLGGLAVTGAAFSNEAVATNRVSLGKGSGTFNLGGI